MNAIHPGFHLWRQRSGKRRRPVQQLPEPQPLWAAAPRAVTPGPGTTDAPRRGVLLLDW